MEEYDKQIMLELSNWKKKMVKAPSRLNRFTKKWQDKFNSFIPKKLNNAISLALKQMVRVVLFGSKITTGSPRKSGSLEVRDAVAEEKIKSYRKTGAVEGALTGAGGILMGLADFSLLLSFKMKLLFDLASNYGFDVSDYRERLYILKIFQLTFSGRERSHEVFLEMENWDEKAAFLPEKISDFEWDKFQQEYRDYLDIAKMAQLIPIIGAPIGAIVNYRMLNKLGHTAINAYRMRWNSMELIEADENFD